jgi:CDP-glucose 4,6-dehydratase
VKSGADIPIALNFGPDPANIRSVAEVLSAAVVEVPELEYVLSDSDDHLKETQLLTLDSRQAASMLGWDNRIDFQKAIEWSFEELSSLSALEIAERQIKEFLAMGTLR